MTEVWKWEAGERTRPLTKEELRDQIEMMLAEWVDAHQGHDSGTDEAASAITDIADTFADAIDEFEVFKRAKV